MRPLLQVGAIFTSCIVQPKLATELFEPGKEYEVTIEVVFWDEYGWLFFNGMPVALFDGSRLVASIPFLTREQDSGGAVSAP